jgi:hypothetical protein
MNEDLIYGIAKTDDVTKDFIGNTVFPMKRLIIRSLNGDILKKYNEEGIYITEGLINDNQLTLKRVEKTGESAAFKEIADDEWKRLVKNLHGLHEKYGMYVQFSYMFDKENLLGYKESPIDRGPEIFMQMFKERVVIN